MLLVFICSAVAALCRRRFPALRARLGSVMPLKPALNWSRWRMPWRNSRSWIKTAAPLLLLLWLAPANAQTVAATGTQLQVLVCVPDQTGTLQASQSPCPASPVASLQFLSGVVLSQSDYANLLSYDGPISQSEGQNLAMTCAGMVIALYLVSLGIGLIVRLIKSAAIP